MSDVELTWQTYLAFENAFRDLVNDACCQGIGGEDHAGKIILAHLDVVTYALQIDRARDTVPGFDAEWRKLAGLPPPETVLPTSPSPFVN